jgi:pimeloyl-ACP methyl ester carboxylesterase
MSAPSIYRSARGEAEIMALYDRTLELIGQEFQHPTVETRFGATHVLVTGPEDGEPLLITHGGNTVNPLSLAWFKPLMKQYRVYAPDTVGHPGRSAQTRLSPQDDSYGLWVSDVLDGLGLDQVAAIGPSYGAGILVRTAIHTPNRLSRLVLIVPSGIVNPPILPLVFRIVIPMMLYRLFPSSARLERAIRPMFTEDERIDSVAIEVSRAAFDHVKIEAQMPRIATREQLAGFEAPTLVLAAEKDIFFPGRKVLARAPEIFPNLEAGELLEGSGHFPSHAVQEWVNDRIAEFLRRRCP